MGLLLGVIIRDILMTEESVMTRSFKNELTRKGAIIRLQISAYLDRLILVKQIGGDIALALF